MAAVSWIVRSPDRGAKGGSVVIPRGVESTGYRVSYRKTCGFLGGTPVSQLGKQPMSAAHEGTNERDLPQFATVCCCLYMLFANHWLIRLRKKNSPGPVISITLIASA